MLVSMRINQFLAHFGGFSRRKADTAITEGRVKINDRPASIGQDVNLTDSVSVDDKVIAPKAYTYVLFHKPIGYVTSREHQGEDPIIYDVLPEKYRELKPIGRLDKDTSGLLLLTNDGALSEALAHPRSQKTKTYRTRLNTALDASTMARIQEPGISLDDGISQMSVRSLALVKPLYEIKLAEGRNRQIRRTFEALKIQVKTLHRTEFGPYQLGDLPKGKYRELDSPLVMQ